MDYHVIAHAARAGRFTIVSKMWQEGFALCSPALCLDKKFPLFRIATGKTRP
jgi:hypothetical protein